MDGDSMKKAGVVTIVILVALYCIAVPVLWMVIGAPLWICIAIGALFLGIAAVVLYQAKVRMREIEEGLEDAVDDY